MELRIPRGDLSTLDRTAAVARLDHFYPADVEHRPRVVARVAHSGDAIHMRFDVADRWMRAVATQFQGDVWKDSCVEFFVHPKKELGYFNFEMNCGGVLLLHYNIGSNKNRKSFTDIDVKAVNIQSSLPAPYESKGDEPIDWWLTLSFPVSIFEPFIGPVGDLSGQRWTGNFQKCGDDTPRPHWVTWSPIGERIAFHQPDKFGTLIFE